VLDVGSCFDRCTSKTIVPLFGEVVEWLEIFVTELVAGRMASWEEVGGGKRLEALRDMVASGARIVQPLAQ